MGEAPCKFVGSSRLGDEVVATAARVRLALGFDVEERRQIPTWTDALRRFIGQADARGVLVMVSGVVGSNNRRHLDPEEFRGFALADPLAPLVFMLRPPTWQQYLVLFIYGAIQLGLPYWLMARGLRSVSAPEAGAITLIEPILNPVWAYFVCGEAPEPLTFVGGAVILGALVYRYWPVQESRVPD